MAWATEVKRVDQSPATHACDALASLNSLTNGHLNNAASYPGSQVQAHYDGERYAVGVVLLRDNAHVNALHAGINDGGKSSFKGMCEEEGATQKCGS